MPNLFDVIVKNTSSGWNAYEGKHIADTVEEAIEEATKRVAYYTTSEFRVFASDLGPVVEKAAEEAEADLPEVDKSLEAPEESVPPVADSASVPSEDDALVNSIADLPAEILDKIKAKLGLGGSGSALNS
jgi:hypothetical protein